MASLYGRVINEGTVPSNITGAGQSMTGSPQLDASVSYIVRALLTDPDVMRAVKTAYSRAINQQQSLIQRTPATTPAATGTTPAGAGQPNANQFKI